MFGLVRWAPVNNHAFPSFIAGEISDVSRAQANLEKRPWWNPIYSKGPLPVVNLKVHLPAKPFSMSSEWANYRHPCLNFLLSTLALSVINESSP
jgi:hypothetical protein